MKVLFDPQIVSYEELFECFFENHDPTHGCRHGGDMGNHYRSAVFTTSEEQYVTAPDYATKYGALGRRGLLTANDRNRAGARNLFGRGVPPAVLDGESSGILRCRRNRRELSD